MTTFAQTSFLTGKIATMDLDLSKEDLSEGFSLWDGGMLIQDAFPTLNAGEREFIKSGITPQEWEAEFGEGFSLKNA